MANEPNEPYAALRDFPSVEILAGHPALEPYIRSLTRPVVVETIKMVIARLKEEFKEDNKTVSAKSLVAALTGELDQLVLLHLTPVINGSGIIIHTNLGRSPISAAMLNGAIEMASGYSNLEFNLATGKRGKRGILVEKLLATLCGTEAGTLVNNNAAALVIILNTLANRKEVIISRGELVQIGGGFRIPDIMIRSGARLVEVGTTNRTTPDDYASAVTGKTAMILKVHRSNFTQEGFVEEASLADLAPLCREHDIALIHDLGSGLISFPPGVEITNEPDVHESVHSGADLTCFSGDKLMGGAQAGLIVGRGDLVGKIKKNPLFRAFRCDKLVFEITTQVLAAYLRGTQFEDIPIWRMINIPVTELKKRGEAIQKASGAKDLVLTATRAYLGGGSTPGQTIPSLALSLRSKLSSTALAKKFRTFSPPIIGRVENEDFLIDLRTIPPDRDRLLIEAIDKIVI
jgi:L-seryl-tRNA(Ser) seleniumtransferase